MKTTGRRFDPTLFDPIPIVSEEQKGEEREVPTEDVVLVEDLDEYLIDLSKPIKTLQYSILINDMPTFPKGDIQAVKARAKQGKTHVILSIMTALLSEEFLNIKSMLENPSICYFATEEQEDSVCLLAKKVHELCDLDCNKNYDRFKVYSLRKLSPEKRLKCVEERIIQNEPDVVFIDGVRDLLNDFNNIGESNKVISLLMKLSEEYNCAIVCILHVNKSDSNMRGHLGTELLNKCSDILEVKKVDEIFIVESAESRNRETGKWYFRLDDTGLPEYVDEPELKTKPDTRSEKMKENFTKVLKNGERLSYTGLRDKYMVVANLKKDAAQKHITEMKRLNFIRKRDDQNYELV